MSGSDAGAVAPELLLLREGIDAVDRDLLVLLNRRAALALEVGEIKKREGSVVFRPEREAQVIDGLKRNNAGPLKSDSVAPISDAGLAGSYGYMWWVARDGIHFPNLRVPEGTYSARGAGGHYIVVVPKLDAVVVHRVDTDIPGNGESSGRFGALLRRILAAG